MDNDNDFFEHGDLDGSDGSFQLQFSPSQRPVRSIDAAKIPQNTTGSDQNFHASFRLSKRFQRMELQGHEVNPSKPVRSLDQPDEDKKQSTLRKLFTRQISLKFSNKKPDTNRTVASNDTYFSVRRRQSLQIAAPRGKQHDHSSLADKAKDWNTFDTGSCPFDSSVVEASNETVVSAMSENSSSGDSTNNNNNNNSSMSIKWLSEDTDGRRSSFGAWDESETFSSTQSRGSTAASKPLRRSSSRSKESPRGTMERRSSNRLVRRASSRRRSKTSQSEPNQFKTDDNKFKKPTRSTSADDVYVSKSRVETSSSKDKVRRSKSATSLPDEACKPSEQAQKDKEQEKRASIKSESRLQHSSSSRDTESNLGSAIRDKKSKRRSSTTIRRFSVVPASTSYTNESTNDEVVMDETALEYPTLLHQIVIIDLWLPNPNMIEARLRQLNGALRDTDDSSVTAIPSDAIVDRIGVAGPVVGAMRKWALHSGIQREACRLIHALVNRESIAMSFHECGAMKAILIAMKTFSLDETIQAAGCGALYSLTCMNNSILSTNLVEQDGFSVIVASMKTFPSSTKIQQRGALVFCCVAQFKELRPALRSGAKLVRDALQTYPCLDDDKTVRHIREPKPDDNPSVTVVAPGA